MLDQLKEKGKKAHFNDKKIELWLFLFTIISVHFAPPQSVHRNINCYIPQVGTFNHRVKGYCNVPSTMRQIVILKLENIGNTIFFYFLERTRNDESTIHFDLSNVIPAAPKHMCIKLIFEDTFGWGKQKKLRPTPLLPDLSPQNEGFWSCPHKPMSAHL